MIPRNIQRPHVVDAIAEADRRGVPERRKPTRYYLMYEGKEYPPKLIISLANRFANGKELGSADFSGGKETNDFLRRLGFNVIERAKEIKNRILSVDKKKERQESKIHDERCPKCKEAIRTLLDKIYGKVEQNYSFDIGTAPEDFKHTRHYEQLLKIYIALQDYRGFKEFVKARSLPNCDFFVPNPGIIVEFDESQHFTIPRIISLKKYPKTLKLGFLLTRWIHLGQKIGANDNDPPFRDEQRAWYDTLRDFLPLFVAIRPTVRLYARDFQWCSLNPESVDNLGAFRCFLGDTSSSFMESQKEFSNRFILRSPEKKNGDKVTIALVFPKVWKPNQKKELPKQVRPADVPEAYEPYIPSEREFGEKHVDLVVFPEEYILFEDEERLKVLCRLAQQLNTIILAGARKSHDSRNAHWQTLVLIQPDATWNLLYHKHATAGAVAFELPDWTPQRQLPVFEVSGTYFGGTICHDSYLGLLQRYLAQRGAKIWINPSYDNVKEEKWSSILRLRAVENGVISLCTLHDNFAKKLRPRTHPFGFAPDGSELKGYPPDKPEEAKRLSECTKPGIYLVECPLDVSNAKDAPDLLPPTKKQPYHGNRKGPILLVSLREGKPYLKVNGTWVPLEHEKPLLVGQMKILPGLISEGQLFDISKFFKVLCEARQQGCKPLFWNQWTQLPTRSDKLVDMMLGRTLEMLAPLILSDRDQIHEITEIAGGTKTMRRISVKAPQGSVDISFALGLPNAFKMTYDKLKGIPGKKEKYFNIFFKLYRSLFS
jgi:predicted amidohydrolase